MGQSTNAILGWGVLVKEGSADHELAAKIWAEQDMDDPVQIVEHCSMTYPMYAILSDALTKTANRGYPVDVREKGIRIGETPTTAARLGLEHFLERMGFSEELRKQEPTYWLMSWWEA